MREEYLYIDFWTDQLNQNLNLEKHEHLHKNFIYIVKIDEKSKKIKVNFV